MELQNHISKGKTVRISETAMLEKRPSVEEQHNVQRIRTLLLFVIAILLVSEKNIFPSLNLLS